MEISALKVFLAVIDSGSFSKASEVLGYTPAGISYIINSLEEELGIKLVERNYSGVTPNSNGMALLQDIRRIINAYDNFENNVKRRREKRYKTLRVAGIDTMSILLLPDAVAAFRTECPDVNVEITTGDPFEINAWLAEGVVDMGLTEHTWASDKFSWVPLAKDAYYAVFPPGSTVPDPCPIDIFKGRDFFLPDYRRDRNISIMLTKYGIQTNELYDSACTQTIIRSIALGRGSTILTALALDLYGGALRDDAAAPVVVPLAPYACREIGVCVKDEWLENSVFQTFLRCLKEAVRHDSLQKKSFCTAENAMFMPVETE